ncbi:terminase small subunit [Nocardia sp. NPDC050697]|uniref:terminase small subunit n=1 Tax=Nocardia sp. NPDC050697 TaxID=3155158 RepID=UPI0033E5CE1F
MADGTNKEEKDKGGRPLKFESVADLKSRINAYFNRCDPHTEMRRIIDGHDREGNALYKDAEVLTEAVPYTITGLARALGTSRETLLDYESGKYDEKASDFDASGEKFSDAIKDAKLRVQEKVEEMSLLGAGSGTIFWLKNNAGWKDKQELDHTSGGQPFAPVVRIIDERQKTE